MSAQPFKVGDVVQLKSGGPKMTVYAVQEDLVRCKWFLNETDHLRTSYKPVTEDFETPGVLKLADDAKSS